MRTVPRLFIDVVSRNGLLDTMTHCPAFVKREAKAKQKQNNSLLINMSAFDARIDLRSKSP